MLISCLYKRVFFIITFYCIAFKVAIWITGWIKSSVCQLSTVQQLHVVHQWWRDIPNKQWELRTQRIVLHFMILWENVKHLDWFPQSYWVWVTMLLSNQIYNGFGKAQWLWKTASGTSFCMSLAFPWFHYIFEQKWELFMNISQLLNKTLSFPIIKH